MATSQRRRMQRNAENGLFTKPPNGDFMKNILVTGGCGFIGSNFIHYLLEQSDFTGRIINVDKLTYAGNPENLTGIAERFSKQYDFIKADICDREAMSEIFNNYKKGGYPLHWP